MTITTKFELRQRVKIIALNLTGIICAVFFGNNGLEYNVRYFSNGDSKTQYLFEEELENL